MDPTFPWYKSKIIQQQIVQLIIVCLGLFGFVTDIDWGATVEAIFSGIAGLVAVWTVITRLFKPAPNITVKAAIKEQELIDRGKIVPRQSGFARVGALILLASAAMVALPMVHGCTGTRAAYGEAKDNLADTAYVVTEHYAALVREAADISALPTTPSIVRDTLKQADRAVKPFIIGDPASGLPGLYNLVNRWQAVRDAKTEADLQAAINAAVRELSNFSRAVKSARGRT